MKKNADNDGSKMFEHARNIQIGKGRILWGTAVEVKNQYGASVKLPEGWVLPGGGRTKDHNVARAWAEWIDQVSQR